MGLLILREVLEKELSKRGIQYFISGSSRFGYDTENSDLDIIILETENGFSLKPIIKDLGGDYKLTKGNMRANYVSNLAEVKVLGGKVHFVLFTMRGPFLLLRKEHQEVCSFLRENPIVVEFVRKLKLFECANGTAIYKAILELMKGPRQVEEKEKSAQRLLRVEEGK